MEDLQCEARRRLFSAEKNTNPMLDSDSSGEMVGGYKVFEGL